MSVTVVKCHQCHSQKRLTKHSQSQLLFVYAKLMKLQNSFCLHIITNKNRFVDRSIFRHFYTLTGICAQNLCYYIVSYTVLIASQSFKVVVHLNLCVRMSYLNSPFYQDALNEDFDSYDEEFEENESEDDVNNNSGKTLDHNTFRSGRNLHSNLHDLLDTEEASESEFNSGSHHRNNVEPVEIKEQ